MKEIELKCLLTLSNGAKEQVVVCLRGGKPIFFEQKEKELLADFNNNQALPTILDMNDLMDNSEGEGDYECLWKGIVKTHQIKKWFYIEDLLKGANNG